MCQLPDPPSEPLQTSRCNDGATLPLSMVGTASRTQSACAATWSQWSHLVATTAFAPPPSAPFPTTLLSCRSLAYSPTPTLPAAVRLGRQSTHNPHSIHTQPTIADGFAVQGRATVYTGAMQHVLHVPPPPVPPSPPPSALHVFCRFSLCTSLPPHTSAGILFAGHVNDPSCLEICI